MKKFLIVALLLGCGSGSKFKPETALEAAKGKQEEENQKKQKQIEELKAEFKVFNDRCSKSMAEYKELAKDANGNKAKMEAVERSMRADDAEIHKINAKLYNLGEKMLEVKKDE